MHLTPKNIGIRRFVLPLLGLFLCVSAHAENKHSNNSDTMDVSNTIMEAERLYKDGAYDVAAIKFKEALQTHSQDSVYLLKKLSFSYAKSNQPELACRYIEKYVLASLDLDFVSHSYFYEIKNSASYQKLANKYLKKIDFWSIFCFNVGFIGLFIAVVLNLRKRSDKVANFLMSAFVFQHSIFILHISLLLTNYWYYIPHSMYSSTLFSFLYGPMIYFYFKRVTVQYVFKPIDLLHLFPTVLLLLFLLPIYMLPGQEKLRMLLHGDHISLFLITICKLISLFLYGGFVIKIYFKFIKNNTIISRTQYRWQRNIAVFCLLYVVTYGIYAFLILSGIKSGLLFNLQVGLMAFLVLYVSYTAFVYPSVFGQLKVVSAGPTSENQKNDKYQKSGLTESLSLELKQKLTTLLNDDKIYRENDITLHKLSNLLDTSRHNASQIINEHFGLNFFELINTYRIQEAMHILSDEKSRNINIIDVAYEVGFNNKVTFNKSFKKYNQITPSEYVKSLVA